MEKNKMLNIEILKLEKEQAEVRVWIPKRATINDIFYIYHEDHIKRLVEKKLKQENKNILSCHFLTEVSKLMNKLDDHETAQTLQINLKNKVEEKKIKKTPQKRSTRKSRKNYKASSSSSSG